MAAEYHQKCLQRIWTGCGGGNSRQGLEIRVHSVSCCLCLPQQTLAFPSPCELSSSTWRSQTTTPNILFCLLLKIVFKVRALAILGKFLSFPGSLPCIHVIKLLLNFLLLTCLMSIEFYGQPKNLEK